MSQRQSVEKLSEGLELLAAHYSPRSRALKMMRLLIRFVVVPHETILTLRSPDIARGFPRYTTWLKRLVVAELLILAFLAIFQPWLLVLVLALIALGSIWYKWQARPSRGRSRGWPPGSIGVGSQAMSDPDYYLNGWQTYGPVFKTNLFDQPIVCVVGVREATELLGEHPDSIAATAQVWNRFIPGGLTRWMKGGELHDHYRRLLAISLGARLMGRNEDLVRREVERTLKLMAAESAESNGVAPLPHIQDLVFGVWAGLFFGIQRTDASFEALLSAFDVISIEKQAPARVVRPALREIQDIVTANFVEVRENAGDDSLHNTLLGEVISQDRDTLSSPAAMTNLIYLMETTSLDVAGFLMWLLHHASAHPQYLDQLQLEGEDSAPNSLVNRMVSESLRLEQSEYLHRRTTGTIEFRGMTIPKGWLVHVCIHESHRDPQIFEEPNLYNPDRFLENRYTANYKPLGIGDRTCVGVPLIREISRRLLLQLATQYEMVIVEDGPRELSAQRHWAPSSRLRLKLTTQEIDRST